MEGPAVPEGSKCKKKRVTKIHCCWGGPKNDSGRILKYFGMHLKVLIFMSRMQKVTLWGALFFHRFGPVFGEGSAAEAGPI